MWFIILGLLAVTSVVILLEKGVGATTATTGNCVPPIPSPDNNTFPINQADGAQNIPDGLNIYCMNYSSQQIAEFAQNAGWADTDIVTATAIALAESNGNASALGDTKLAPNNGPSLGLWQINIGSKAHPELANENLYDPQTNANFAYQIWSKAGNSFKPWSTFTNKAYTAHLDVAQQGFDSINV